jgi:hypothetical protein
MALERIIRKLLDPSVDRADHPSPATGYDAPR